MLAASDYYTIRLWKTTDGAPLLEIHDPKRGGFDYAAISADTKLLACTHGHVIQVWDLTTKHARPISTGHEDTIENVVFAPASGLLASAGDEGKIRVWDAADGRELCQVQGRVTVLFSPDGGTFVSHESPARSRLVLWDSRSGRQLRTFATRRSGEQVGHQWIHADRFSRDGRVLYGTCGEFVGSKNSHYTKHRWDVQSGNELSRAEGRESDLWGRHSPDGRFLVSTKGMLETADGRSLFRVHPDPKGLGLTGWLISEFSPDSRLVAAPSYKLSMRNGLDDSVFAGIVLWEIASHQPVLTLPVSELPNILCFSPNGRIVASGSGDQVALWDIASGKSALRFAGIGANVTAAAFSSDGRLLATGLDNGTVLLWPIEHPDSDTGGGLGSR